MRVLTPPGVAGVAVVRFAADERTLVTTCLRTPLGGPFVARAGDPPRRAALWFDGAAIDEVLVVDRGTVGLELHTHGSPAVLAALAHAFPGSATPTLAPAAQLLREAIGTAQLDLAIEQLAFDFDEFLRAATALPAPERQSRLAAARERSRVARALVEPARLVLVGAQNAGKSSLCNRLLFRERVLTGPVAGLTRDPVAELTTLDGYPYEVVDTAGEGITDSPLAREALERGRRLRHDALLLLVVDASVGPSDSDRALAAAAALVCANKSDLPAAPWPGAVRCDLTASCRTEDAVLLRARFGAALRRWRGLPPAGPVGGVAALSAADAARLG